MNKRRAARLTLACAVVCIALALAALARPSRAGSVRATAPALPQTFNLADFGAAGDGVTDDGPALQAALDAVIAAGGGTLLVPAGHFAINTPVSANSTAGGVSVEIRGVESSTPVPPPTADGQTLSQGLSLATEFLPRTGPGQVALTFLNLRGLFIKDIAFVGTPDVETDALITLSLVNIPDAVIRHCEFYGLSSTAPGGAIVQNWNGGLTLQQSEFLGCTANSGLYTPVVQNYLWESVTVEDTIFIDYGQRPELYAKTGLGSPLSWVNIGHAAPPTARSSRREVVLRNLFLDEGGWEAITSLPARYQSPTVPLDLFYATGLYVNVSNFVTTGLYLTGFRQVLVEDSIFTWSHQADSAVDIVDAQDAILDRLRTSGAATRLKAEYQTGRLTVIDSVYTDLASAAQQTVVLNPSTPDEDPVRYARAQFTSKLGRAPDAAALYYWSRLLLDCGADAACVTSRRAKLAAYLATNPVPTFDLTGRATDENGQPLAGVAVTLTGTHSSATVSVLTGADGTYAFGHLPTSGSYSVSASKRHYVFTAPTVSVVTPPGAQVVNFPAHVNRYSIGGRLLDEGGRAIQGATLTLSGAQAATTTSDAQGNYAFTNLAAGGSYTVNASGTRYGFANPSQSFTDLDANKTANFTGTSLFYVVNGQVVDPANKPVTGLSVALSGGKTATASTDAQGKFTFTDLPRGGSYTVTPAKFLGYLFTPASKSFDNLTADQTPAFVAVPTNFKLAGRVTSNGAALAGVTVTLTGSKTGTATTDANGNYTFSVPVHGDYAVAPSKSHYTFDRASVSFGDVTADRAADFVATLDRFKIGGSVRRANGAAMAGVTVTLSNGQGSATRTTDAQGAYSFPNVPAGDNYTVKPSLAGYDFAPASKSFTDLGADSTADFTVAPASVSISGRVAEGANALAGVTVTLTGAKTGTATTDANGSYSFTVTSEGNYTVTPSKAHYKFAPASSSFNNPTAAQKADFAATLDRFKISGRVTDKDDAGVAGATVTLSGAQAGTATSDAQGNYSFANLPAGGDYTLTAAKTNYSFSPASSSVKDLGSDTVSNFKAALLDYQISGRVTLNASGLAGVTVTLSGTKTGGTTTDAQGRYSFTAPAGGNYTLSASLKNYIFTPPAAALQSLGGDRTVDFTAALDRHSILGRVAYVSGAPVAGVTLTLSGAQAGTTTSDAQGNYSFADLPAGGSYTVSAALAHHSLAPASQTFNDLGGSARANFTASFLNYRVGGRVTEKGAPLAGVNVELKGTHDVLGAQAATATTGADGAYSFNVPAGGDYTVTPSKKNYAFDREAAEFKSLASDQTADFAGRLLSVLSFSPTSYTVAEGGGLTLTVTREGDATGEATAVYEGRGDTAKMGSDFVTAVGTVVFAPGETTKSFSIFITDDGFVEGPEHFTVTLTPGAGTVAGDTTVASVTINDNDSAPSPVNPVDDDDFFVRQQYRDFLSREPDAAGLKFWTDEIRKCGTNAQCREARRVSVSAAFFLSIEFKETGYLVYRLYRATYGRAPARLGEFMLDARVVGDGVVVGETGWAERLAANKRDFFDDWTRRPEFAERYAALDDAAFLQAIFQNMNVTPTDARRGELLAQLAAGSTRAQVLAEVIEDEQFNRRELNRAFVLMQYFGYLRRDPTDPPDSDLTGYNHWLSKLDEFGGDYERAEMVKAFLSSLEYRGRFGN